ncbi:SAM complex subunit SAM35 Ecym_8006 [Eremothecium cymbalariae DBVPG|uniref:Uncharacterized protein n=1 Tax=Eremothecium cymbalariae (strain CBS 270.75 / DBVPG 7215 / KCTC 17166 / NRRL Y-17582) TaxID=931890 RepID=G8JXX6_ERECY|nr:Hypothetical protein Ecym_8006 [Eremothecium cymbalariae DBVPG\
MEVPAPIKQLFDQFPLVSYGPVAKNDNSLKNELQQRTYPFEGNNAIKSSPNDVLKLCVYNVITHEETKSILASDPWCLFIQLAICQKNSVRLCKAAPNNDLLIPNSSVQQNDSSYPLKHCMLVVSHHAATSSHLPMLIEGYQKRYIRQTHAISEIMDSKIADNPIEIMYMTLLDTVISDAYVSQLLFETPDHTLLRLYARNPPTSISLLQSSQLHNLKTLLRTRNNFHLRHIALANYIKPHHHLSPPSNHSNKDPLLHHLLQKSETVLLQFQELVQHHNLFSESDPLISKNSDSHHIRPAYLDLKLASYILAIQQLSGSSLQLFIAKNCKQLIRHSTRVLSLYT